MVITLGSNGCEVVDAESRSVPAPRVEAVDTVAPATPLMVRWRSRCRRT